MKIADVGADEQDRVFLMVSVRRRHAGSASGTAYALAPSACW